MSEIVAMVGKYHRPSHRRMLTLAVHARERISAHFVSLTLGGPDVDLLEKSGYDQWGRFFIPGPGQVDITIPSSTRWRVQIVSAAKRPRIRSYTIRRFRPELSAFDIEVAVHENADDAEAPGSAWALSAHPGDTLGFLDEGHSYGATPNAEWQLLVGDESAVPAILAIVERSILPTQAFLEVPTRDDVRRDIPESAAGGIHWLPRDDDKIKPGTLALQAVKDARLAPGPFYTWVAGESSLPTGVRRHLVNDRGVPKSDIAFTGYWRHGRASLG
jgi:NADPH-dependent ferric siderophore reductase